MVVNNKTAPESLVTTAGAWTRPTEAEQAAKLIMAPGRAFRKGAPSCNVPPVKHLLRSLEETGRAINATAA